MDGKSFLRRVFSRLFKGPSDNAASDNAGAENAEKAANALPQKDRDLLAALTVAGARANVSRDVVGTTRRLVARAARATPQRIADFMSSLSEISTVASDVEKSLVKDPSIVFGRAGARVGAGRGSALDSADQSSFRFDVRDVRFWVGFAAHAGVAHVPFREVLRLSDDEISALSGQISLPDIATVRRFSGNMRAAETILRKETPREGGAGIQTRDSSEEKGSAEHLAKTDVSTISEKTAAALDDLPAGWMVRHSCCSSEATKIFMNMGIGDASALLDGLRVTETAKIGPGWIQIGNRRMVDVTDARILKVGIASGPGGDQVFVARPWRPSDRKLVGIDPHRKDTSLRAEGVWPAEWRAFIRNGIVEGVSGYYAWSHPRDAHDAAMALAVRAAAEKVVAAAIALRAQPVFMDAELRRAAASMRDRKRGWEQGGEGDAGECSGFDATIDFVESCDENGVWRPVLLEGGPGFHAFGGGHPCGFTGLRRPEGVALGVMPDADLMNPGRHVEDPSRSSAGIVFGWDEIADLASKFDGKIAVLEAEWPKQALDRPSACQAVESGATTISP